MGMNVNAGGKGVQAEINITPFIDIVLVLLIVYMASLPVLMVKTPLEIPRKLDDNQTISIDTKQFVLTVKADTSIMLADGEKETPMRAVDVTTVMRPLLAAVLTDKVVFVDFEDGVSWGDAVGVMDSIRTLSLNAAGEQTNEIKVALKVPDPIAAQ